MSQFEKLLKRIRTIPKDFTYDEMRTLLKHLGFEENTKGKTSGSSVSFFRKSDGRVFMFHKPHPGNIVKQCYLKKMLKMLDESGDVDGKE